MVSAAHLHLHLLVLVFHVNLVLHLLLVVSIKLRSPCSLFSLLKFALILKVFDLLGTLSINVSNLVRAQSLEVVRHVTVTGMLGGSCVEILGHNVRLEGVVKLASILLLLILVPCCFTSALFLSHTLVFFLHGFHHGCLFVSSLILKHSTHASDGGGLVSIGLLFSSVTVILTHLFTLLLSSPLLLLEALHSNTLVITEVLTFELEAAGGELRSVLCRAVEALSCSFHLSRSKNK